MDRGIGEDLTKIGEEKLDKTTKTSRIFLLTAVITTLVLLVPLSTAQDSESELNVTVNISEETIIDIQPSQFAWGVDGAGIIPGNVADSNDEQNGYGSIMIENLGSVDINQVWFENTQPDERPFGTGDSSVYDPGNFLTLNNGSGHRFIERREYALSSGDGDIVFINTPTGWDTGRFRNGSKEYFWALEGTAENDRLRIATEHRNETQTGSTNFEDTCSGGETSGTGTNDDCNEYTLSADGSTDVMIGSTDDGSGNGPRYCAIAQTGDPNGDTNTQTWVDFGKYDPTATGASSGGCSSVTGYTVTSGSPLVPGEFINVGIRSFIPYGVVSGTLPDGKLTVFANSAN